MIALRSASPSYVAPKDVSCLSRVGNALTGNAHFVIGISDTCVYVYGSDALHEQGKLKRTGVRCCALAEKALLVVDEMRFEIVLLSTASPAKPPVLVYRQEIFFLASDCAMVERAPVDGFAQASLLVVALAGPAGLHMTSVSRAPVARGTAAAAVAAEYTLFRRSSVACCAMTATHIGAACVDGHIAVVPIVRALQQPPGGVRDDEFCAYLPSEQRPTHCCFAPSGEAFVCVAWDGTAIVVTHDGHGADTWAATRLIPYLAFDRARVGPPAFALLLSDECVTVARGATVGQARVPADERIIGATNFAGRILVLDCAHQLHSVLLDTTQPTSLVCPGLTAQEAQRVMAPVLPLDCVAFCDDTRDVRPPCLWCCEPNDFIVAAYGSALVSYTIAVAQHVAAELDGTPIALTHDQHGRLLVLLLRASGNINTSATANTIAVLQLRDAHSLQLLCADVTVPAIEPTHCEGRCTFTLLDNQSARFVSARQNVLITVRLT